MSSSAWESNNVANHDATSSYRKGLQYFQDKSYKQAFTYLEKAIEKEPTNSEIYFLKSQCEYYLQSLNDSYLTIIEGINVLEANTNGHYDPELKAQMLEWKTKLYKELKNGEDQHGEGSNGMKASKKNGVNGEANGKTVKMKKVSNNEDDSEREEDTQEKNEVQTVYDLFQTATEKKLLTTEFNMVHIVSMKWFEKWKKYTGFQFDVACQAQSSPTDKATNDSNEGLLKEDQEKTHPGPIDSDDILEDLGADTLADPDKVREYCNMIVKQGLIENKDFIILPHPVWLYLHGIYGGKDLKRYVISLNDEGSQTAIEIWLKKVNVLVLPPVGKNQKYSQCKVQELYLSRKETVKELREKITRIYKSKGNISDKAVLSSCRMWKYDPREDLKQLIKEAEESNEIIPLRGKKLTDGMVLEDAEIGDIDIVICEYKVGNTWKFITEEEHLQIALSRCGNCGLKKENLPFCECKTIKYCDASCQKLHRPKHKEKCIKVKNTIHKNHEIMRQFKLSHSKFSPTSRYGICGLQNLGNTCFMNSSLQCLSHIQELTYYFLENRFIKDLNRHNRLGTGGRLAAAYAELMKDLWHGSDHYVSPWDIKKIIAEVASQFSGYNQQDAAEFMSYLVDGLHEDLNKIVNKPYVETIESSDRPDEIVAKQSWENHVKRNQSIIVDLLHGQFKSKLVCPDCKKISITFDPFMTLSLPIPNSNQVTLSLYFSHKNNKNLPYKMLVTLDPSAPSSDVVDKLSEMLSIPKEAIEMNLLKEQVIARSRLARYDVKSLKEEEMSLFAYQTHDPEVDGPLDKFLEEEKIKIEIKIFKNEEDGPVSFSRVLYMPKKASLKETHLQIYYMMRGYLVNVYPPDASNTSGFSVDILKNDMETLEKEYAAFRNLAANSKYESVYEVGYMDDDKKCVFLPYNEHETIFDKTLGLIPCVLMVIWSRSAGLESIKLNKCHDFEGNSAPAREKRAYSLNECFDLFTTPEVLDQENLWYCNRCKEHKQATKKMDIYKFPKILILHLKRFKTSRVHSIGSFFFSGGSSKITTLIDFPIENLDLTNYALGKWDEPPIYDLFAVTNHYGSLGGGHYTACAKNPTKKMWYDFNDSSVTKQDPDELVTGAAYLLFYKRREVEKPNNGSSN